MLNLVEKAYAQVLTLPNLTPKDGSLNVKEAIQNVANFILYLAGAIAIIYLIFGGITYITAGGDEKKALAGKTAVVNAIIGIAIVLASLIIISIVKNTVNGQFKIN